MPSAISLKFNTTPSVDGYITLKSGYSDNGLKETFKTVRTANYQSQTNTVNNIFDAINKYTFAFNADYVNFTGEFVITTHPTEPNTITIEYGQSGFFTLGEVEFPIGFTDITVFSIVDTPDVETIEITSSGYSESTFEPCSRIDAEIVTNIQTVYYTLNNGFQVPVNNTNFTIKQFRSSVHSLKVYDVNGNFDELTLNYPSYLNASNVSVDIVNAPTGATVTVLVDNSDGLTLEYSLDDITYQEAQVFAGILEGDYTVYIRDNFGCSVTYDFTVPPYEESGITVDSPYSDLPSKSNSIRFSKVQDNFDNCSVFQIDENSLSCNEAYVQNPRLINQLFNGCDLVTTQIRTNYETINITVFDDLGNETNIPTEKKSNNTAKKDKRDCIKYDLGIIDGVAKSGVYFMSGNTYDYDTNAINGSYVLNGALPEWGFVGNNLVINNVWFQIVDILFDESKNAEVLVINASHTGGETTNIVGSVYNLQPYEVYEFTINMGLFIDSKIQVLINQTDTRTGYEDVNYLSEIISVKEKHNQTVAIKYYNDVNTDIFWSTGIEMIIRMPIEFISGVPLDESENEKTDTNTYLVNSEMYEANEFNFALISKGLMWKLCYALSYKNVYIDSVQYVKNESVNVVPVVGTNLYRVVSIMIKADKAFSSNGSGESIEVGTFEVPNLIEQNSNGYLKNK